MEWGTEEEDDGGEIDEFVTLMTARVASMSANRFLKSYRRLNSHVTFNWTYKGEQLIVDAILTHVKTDRQKPPS